MYSERHPQLGLAPWARYDINARSVELYTGPRPLEPLRWGETPFTASLGNRVEEAVENMVLHEATHHMRHRFRGITEIAQDFNATAGKSPGTQLAGEL